MKIQSFVEVTGLEPASRGCRALFWQTCYPLFEKPTTFGYLRVVAFLFCAQEQANENIGSIWNFPVRHIHRLWIIESEKSEVPTSIRFATFESIFAQCVELIIRLFAQKK